MVVQGMEYPHWVLQSIQSVWHGPPSEVGEVQLPPVELSLLAVWLYVSLCMNKHACYVSKYNLFKLSNSLVYEEGYLLPTIARKITLPGQH